MSRRGLAGEPDLCDPRGTVYGCAGCAMALALILALWLVLAWVGLRVAQVVVYLVLGG